MRRRLQASRMHYADNVDYPPLLRRPIVFLPALALLFELLRWWNIGSTAMGRGLSGLLHLAALSPAAENMLVAALTTLVVGFNLAVVIRLPLRWQVYIVWLEFAALLLVFFYSFNLSFEFIQRKIGFLLRQGLVMTLYISVVSISIASVLALLGAVAKLSSNGIALGIANFYTSLFRGIPLLMQIYMIYLGLPQLGYVVNAVPTGIAALSLCYGAYMTEIFRAGIESIPKGQWEAARALGLKPASTTLRIILPQAMRVIIPPTGNQFIAMLKDSSLVSVVGVWELMYLARTQGQTEFRHVEMMITASMIYWIFSIMLELIQGRIERYYGRAHAH
ncbi:MAG: amino acid ABC transporter permease [Steroidobacteraceae bacterium]